MTDYNYDEFSPDTYDFNSANGPAVGDKAPNFRLTTAGGEMRDLMDFEGRFLVLELGSITCPLFQSRRSGMRALENIPDVSSAILYVREAHPGAMVPAHVTDKDKLGCAQRLKNEDGESRTVFVDGINGEAHQAYGSMPNSVFIIDSEGVVAFRSQWNNQAATRKALDALIKGREAKVKSYFRPALPTVAHRTLKNGGKGSAADFFRGLPTLVWNNVVKYNLRILFGSPK